MKENALPAPRVDSAVADDIRASLQWALTFGC
jgi:hypothetical protein